MYLYKRAVGINKFLPKGEELLEIGDVKTNELSNLYENLLIVVEDLVASREVTIDFIDYRNQLTAYDGFIQGWLDTMSTTELITTTTLPSTEYRYVTTHDIQYEWFDLLPGDSSLGEDHQEHVTVSSGDDIKVKKTDRLNFDHGPLVDRTLWTINGHLVRAVKGSDGVYLLGAGKHFRVYDNIHVNCLNFNTVSKVKTYPIAEENLRFTDLGGESSLHFSSPINLKGKTVWMSIGGRLYFNDIIQIKGENSLTIRKDKVDWFTRIFDSKNYIDLSSVIDEEREVVGSRYLETEEFFINLLTDASSFLIVLDNPNIHIERRPITTYFYPFTYHTEETRAIPLLTGGGLLPKYFTRTIINRRLLDTDMMIQRRYLSKTTGVNNGGDLLHDKTNRHRPSYLDQGYLLYIRGLLRED